MNKTKGFLLAAAATFMLSCSDELKPIERETWEQHEAAANAQSSSSSGGEAGISSSSGAGISSSGEEQKITISGVSQKGPFLNKTPVTLNELNNSLAPTGNTFLVMTDDKGNFKIEGIELAFPYALLMANGYYRNEVTGENSAAPITLYAIADIRDRSSVNVNILTHLEYDRVKALVEEEGKSFGKAKEQALGEILKVFGIDGSNFKSSEDMSIFGESDSDAALLAISILLQSNLTEGSFLDLLAEFGQKLKEDGTWDNKAKKAAMAVWASSVKLSDIRKNIAGWEPSQSVPEFEKYINDYAVSNSPKGDCEDSEDYFCYNGQLHEKCNGNTYNPDNSFCYKKQIVEKCGGMDYAPPEEVCNFDVVGRKCGTEWYNPSVNYCQSNRLWNCDNKPYNPATQFCYNYVKIYDLCGGNEYDPATQFCYGNSKVGSKCGTRTEIFDPNLYECRDGKIYLITPVIYEGQDYGAVLIGEQTWLAKNLNYDISGSKCYKDSTHYCDIYGRLYDWSTAMGIDIKYNTTLWNGSDINHQGICPPNWHIPSNADWDKLYRYVDGSTGTESPYKSPMAGKYLKETESWNNCGISGSGKTHLCEDTYGFSALPGGVCGSNNTFSSVQSSGKWWSASGSDKDSVYSRSMDNDSTIAFWNYNLKSWLRSVRCIQN
jgi:uncharacterized protein (TIGR02145 family)